MYKKGRDSSHYSPEGQYVRMQMSEWEALDIHCFRPVVKTGENVPMPPPPPPKQQDILRRIHRERGGVLVTFQTRDRCKNGKEGHKYVRMKKQKTQTQGRHRCSSSATQWLSYLLHPPPPPIALEFCVVVRISCCIVQRQTPEAIVWKFSVVVFPTNWGKRKWFDLPMMHRCCLWPLAM